MNVLRTVDAVRAHLAPLRVAGTIGFVPTMGALHEGHAALVRAARQVSTHVVASIFVNPTQFNDPADLAAYPRQEAQDAALAAAAGVDTLFVPNVGDIYDPREQVNVEVQGAAVGFEGAARPGHFNGVATVCVRLFAIVGPHVALFGQKDAQQVAVIRQVVRDRRLDVRIEVVPTVRDADRLALSSRNVRLSKDERRRAQAIPRALAAGLVAASNGRDPSAAARAELRGLDVEYADVTTFDGAPTLVVAVRVGRTRLIDNVPLEHPELAGLAR